MKKRFLVGTALTAIALAIAFNVGMRLGSNPIPVASELSTEAADAESISEQIATISSIPQVTPIEVAQSELEHETVSEITGSKNDNPNGSNDGIKVHGQWTIDVTTSEGKLVSHNEFENSLDNSGAAALSKFLSHENSVGAWAVMANGAHGDTSPCALNGVGGTGVWCWIYELPITDPYVTSQTHFFGGLTVDSPSSGSNNGKLVITGSFEAFNTSEISTVATLVSLCSDSITVADAASCHIGPQPWPFTSKLLNPAVPVVSGQLVNITVVISFS